MNQKSTPDGPIRNLQDTINQFADRYGTACVKCAIIKEDELFLYLADITIQHKNAIPIKEKIQEYDNLILAVVPFTLDELKTMVGKMKSGEIYLKSLGKVNAKNGFYHDSNFVSSRTYQYGCFYDWPCRCFRAALNENNSFQNMNNPLIKTGLPAYPNVIEACNDFFQHREDLIQHTARSINFLIPNYEGRITELKIDGKEILVSVENKELAMDNLVTKISCKNHDNKYQHSEDLRSNDGRLKFSVDFVPNEVFVYLINSQNDKRIDSKIFSPKFFDRTEGIAVTTSVESLEVLLAEGENQRTEFKYDLDRSNMEFLESVVSFANTNRGTILLGINDDGRVVGFFEDFDKITKKIRGLVSNRCEPDITVKIDKIDFEGKLIVVVHVEEGEDKPYLLIGKSAYKRVDKDDRVFTRHDFDKILSTISRRRKPYA